MSRTPEQDAAVIETLMEIRPLVMGRHEVYEGVFPNGEKYRSVLYETNPRIAAIDYAIGVIEATQPRGGHPMPAPGTPGYDRIAGIIKPVFATGSEQDFGLIEVDQ